MMQAMWNNRVVARSDNTIVVEGNHYFPADSVDPAVLRQNSTTTTCPWKGIAHYYDLLVDGQTNPGAAWYYPQPKPAAAEIQGRIAFWKGVAVANAP